MYTFIETRLFTRLVDRYLAEDELRRLQIALAQDPERGPVIPGSGGVRKLRWAGSGRGKRGGIRVIYYVRRNDGEIWLLTLYAKNETNSIPVHILRAIREEIDTPDA